MTLKLRGVLLTPEVERSSSWWMTYSKHQMMWIDWVTTFQTWERFYKVLSLFIWQQAKKKKKVRTEEKQIRELYKRNQNLSGKAGNSIHVRMPKETLTWFEMKLALRAIFPLESWVSDVLFSPPRGIDFIIRFFLIRILREGELGTDTASLLWTRMYIW